MNGRKNPCLVRDGFGHHSVFRAWMDPATAASWSGSPRRPRRAKVPRSSAYWAAGTEKHRRWQVGPTRTCGMHTPYYVSPPPHIYLERLVYTPVHGMHMACTCTWHAHGMHMHVACSKAGVLTVCVVCFLCAATELARPQSERACSEVREEYEGMEYELWPYTRERVP